MNTKTQQDTDAILAMKAENDRLREDSEMLDWLIQGIRKGHTLMLLRAPFKWYVETRSGKLMTEFHATPRAAIREAMGKSK
jgi:hypothetical protein